MCVCVRGCVCVFVYVCECVCVSVCVSVSTGVYLCVLQVFGDISIPGMDKDMKKALERGAGGLQGHGQVRNFTCTPTCDNET